MCAAAVSDVAADDRSSRFERKQRSVGCFLLRHKGCATSENTPMKPSNINTPTESTSRFGHAVIEMLTRIVIILSATLTFATVAAVA
jgi:hypothetical protein